MVTTKIGSNYTIKIPKGFRTNLHIGQQVAVSVDGQGRLILTPMEQARAILEETFGIWAKRTDVPKSGIRYMDQIRRGRRLKNLGIRKA